jgi:FkbM family methyltransferase
MEPKIHSYIRRALKIISTLGVLNGFLHIVKAKILRDKFANNVLWMALRGERINKIDKNGFIWRNKIFFVPAELMDQFFSVLSEIIEYRAYSFERKHDVIIDVGGFLGETAWWFITEGYAKKVIVFEPVYYEICKRNVGEVSEVYPQAVHYRKEVLRFKINGLGSRSSLNGERATDTITLNNVLNSLSGNIAVKMDCEGCEEALIYTPCDVLRRVEEYIVEIHPWVSMESIVRYMESCGFSASPRLVYSSDHIIYHFRRRHLTSGL